MCEIDNATTDPKCLKKFCETLDIPVYASAGRKYLLYWLREHIRVTTIPKRVSTNNVREECEYVVIIFSFTLKYFILYTLKCTAPFHVNHQFVKIGRLSNPTLKTLQNTI